MSPLRRLQSSIALLFAVIVFGTTGYCLIENWSILDSFYMTLITIATIGYSEVHVLSYHGRIFTLILIIVGVGTMGYTLGSITQFLVEGQIRKVLGKIKMEKEILKLTNHFIVCGYGKIGRQICKEFSLRNLKVVVVEPNLDVLELVTKDNHLCIHNDASDEEVLKRAGIERAQCLVAATSSDASNVFITLTARELNPKLFIVARSETPSSEKKIMRAGADRVISPVLIGAKKIALAAISPNIVEFMEIITPDQNTGYIIEEVVVRSGSSLIGKSLRGANIRQESGAMIIGIKKEQQGLILNPPADTNINQGDLLIAVGDKIQIKKLEKLLDPLDTSKIHRDK